MARGNEPKLDNIVKLAHVKSFLGRTPTPEDLDMMAESNTFLSREDRMLYDAYGSFTEVPEYLLPED